jgi:hypothetical protein
MSAQVLDASVNNTAEFRAKAAARARASQVAAMLRDIETLLTELQSKDRSSR